MPLLAPKWIARYLRWKSPFKKGAQEAADHYLGKAGKLQTFNDMTMAADLDELADADREAVAQFRDKKMGFTHGNAGSNKDRIVCDDLTINAGGSGLLPMVLGAALALGAAYFFLGKSGTPAPAVGQSQPAPTQINVPDTAYDVLFYDKDGNQITVPRLPQ
jgi:hypothetical protein